jgi:DNA-binding transcriptional MerR regulator
LNFFSLPREREKAVVGMAVPMKTLSIQEISARSGISKHTLRFWEKELSGVIVPLRTKGGQRRYTFEHVLVVEEIKRLKGKGYSLDDIKRDLNGRFSSEVDRLDDQGADVLAKKIAEMVRAAVFSFLEEKAVKE